MVYFNHPFSGATSLLVCFGRLGLDLFVFWVFGSIRDFLFPVPKKKTNRLTLEHLSGGLFGKRKLIFYTSSVSGATVDGQNPAPPGMVKTL